MTSTGSSTASISWRRLETEPREPIVFEGPYVELKLEHPGLEATRFRDAFFPDAIPYRLGDEHRIFYWRSAFQPATLAPKNWDGLCATTHALTAVTHEKPSGPRLWTRRDDCHELVVDGTIAGDSTTIGVRGYATPDILVSSITPEKVRLDVADDSIFVSADSRRSVQLPPQTVSPLSEATSEVTISPRLVVRYPGTRTVYHPALGGEYALFPSFGLDIDDFPNPIPVPTNNGELDHHALSSMLEVDLSDRPYPERVLWQAFAYNAFDPSREGAPQLTQLDDLILLENPL